MIFLFSLIYGPIGIAGMATGEFLTDIIYYLTTRGLGCDEIIRSLLYFLFVYFLSYFNYKLFYTFNFKNKQVSLRLNNVKNLIKFVLVSIIMFAFDLYSTTFANHYLLYGQLMNNDAMMNDFFHGLYFLITLSAVISLLIMSTFGLFNLKVYKPKKSKFFLNHSKTLNILIFISSIILVIQIVHMILFKGTDYINSLAIYLNINIIMLFVIFKPITKDVEVKKVKNSFNEFIVFIFMFIYTVSWLGNKLWNLDTNLNSFNLLVFIYQNTGFMDVIRLAIVFIILIIIMYYIQNNFSNSLHSLYNITKDYNLIKINNMENENSDSKDIENILCNLKNLSNAKYEVGKLADSLKNMIEDNELYATNLKKVTIEKEKIVSELNMASKIQSSVIPNTFPPFPDRLNDFDIYASFNSAKNVGGDFYDYFLIDDDHLVLVMGDVNGKGVPAALFMMIAKSLIKLLVHSGLSPSEAFYQLNNQLLENNAEKMFVTAWLGILEISSGKLTYVNAGHNPPYLFNKSTNKYAILGAKPNLVLGGMDNIKYIQHETKLIEGDRLYLYAIGITKSINQDLKEFSNERLLNVLNNKNHYSIKDLILEISNVIHNLNEDMEQFDDETMLLLEYRRKNI
jgi:serine phosphatase RsbU (regulator of sigma subunit)